MQKQEILAEQSVDDDDVCKTKIWKNLHISHQHGQHEDMQEVSALRLLSYF